MASNIGLAKKFIRVFFCKMTNTRYKFNIVSVSVIYLYINIAIHIYIYTHTHILNLTFIGQV